MSISEMFSIKELVEREVAKRGIVVVCSMHEHEAEDCTKCEITSAVRSACLAVAKAVVEECAKIANETVVEGEGYATSAFIEQKIRALLADPRPEGSET